ncbi:hypothetical protein BC826DRAFT_62650 [Russula brevipes]|nr:hypothetical protein BC826DRAFT_62650 [Russula brevipes]
MHPSPRPPFPVPIPIPVPSAFPLPRQPGLGLWVAAPVEPRHPSQYVETFPVEPLTTSAWSNPSPTTKPTTEQNDQFRLSMERFHAFDSQISTIHTRTSQSPPPPGSAANVGANINLAVPASQARVDDKVAGVDGRVASVGIECTGQGQASGQVQSVL